MSIADVDATFAADKFEFFTDLQIWPIQGELAFEGWLGNFPAPDRDLALHLFNAFQFFSEPLTTQILRSAVLSVSRVAAANVGSLSARRDQWQQFLDRAVLTSPTGEDPNPSDSGNMFARKARKYLDFPEKSVMFPKEALDRCRADPTTPLVFVDDFAGTGEQFITTWRRTYDFGGHQGSFASTLRPNGIAVYYCPAFCTSFAEQRIRGECPGVRVLAGHVLPAVYSLIASDSVLWPDRLRAQAREFVKRHSLALGLPDTNGRATNDWQGFWRLGLGVAFYDRNVPDATIPLFYHEAAGWQPLIRRR